MPSNYTDINSHLEHVEDLMFLAEDGVYKAIDVLNLVHNKMVATDIISPDVQITTKFDGAPAIVWGHKDGKFFVSTKSAFNKKPLLCFSQKDICDNFSNEGLRRKLYTAFLYLKSVTVQSADGVERQYQGDYMFDHSDVEVNKEWKCLYFQPNLIKYNVFSSPMEDHIWKAQIGIALHTAYVDFKQLAFEEFRFIRYTNPEVFFFNLNPPTWTCKSTPKQQESIFETRWKLEDQSQLFDYKAIEPLNKEILRYQNAAIKSGGEIATEDFIEFLQQTKFNKLSEIKTVKTLDKWCSHYQDLMGLANKNYQYIERAFCVYLLIRQLKNVYIEILDGGNVDFVHTINGEPAGPEGYVVSSKFGRQKLVNREKFSKANFHRNQNGFADVSQEKV